MNNPLECWYCREHVYDGQCSNPECFSKSYNHWTYNKPTNKQRGVPPVSVKKHKRRAILTLTLEQLHDLLGLREDVKLIEVHAEHLGPKVVRFKLEGHCLPEVPEATEIPEVDYEFVAASTKGPEPRRPPEGVPTFIQTAGIIQSDL